MDNEILDRCPMCQQKLAAYEQGFSEGHKAGSMLTVVIGCLISCGIGLIYYFFLRQP